jgi:hypothetical protein
MVLVRLYCGKHEAAPGCSTPPRMTERVAPLSFARRP